MHDPAPPFTLGILAPPYHAVLPCADLTHEPAELASGSVLILRVLCPASACLLLPSVLPPLRARLPSAPLVICLGAASPEAIHLTGRAVRLHARAVVTDGEPWEPTLRRILTRPVDLGADVMEWLALRGVAIPGRTRSLVEALVHGALGGEELARILSTHGEAETTARSALRAAQLPPPGEWFRMSRALRAVLAVQGVPRRNLFEVALDLGYSDHSALSQQMRRCFGLRPGEVRETVGWEWVLERWVRRAVEERRQAA